MAQIRNNPDQVTDRVVIEYHPSEILNKTVYAPSVDETKRPNQARKLAEQGYQIGDAIRTAAWRDLCINAPRIVESRDFLYGSIEVIEGKFVVSFFDRKPAIADPP